MDQRLRMAFWRCQDRRRDRRARLRFEASVVGGSRRAGEWLTIAVMSEPAAQEQSASHAPDHAHEVPVRPRWSIYEWAWFIVKNVIGWVLMLLAFPVGMAVPGPG